MDRNTTGDLSDLFEEFAVLSLEVEHGRLAEDAPQVRALADRMAAAMEMARPKGRFQKRVREPN